MTELTRSGDTPADDPQWKYAEQAMTWYGWGSPVGAGIFLVGLGLFILLVRFAVLGL
jgi:hypothetical protein